MMDYSVMGLSEIYTGMITGSRNVSKSGDKLDREEFLLLLVTQLRNQNPLEPLENKDLVIQLSQLASFEGISNMVDSVEEFVKFNTSLIKAQAASMVGKYVVVKSNTFFVMDGIPEPVNFKLDEPAHLVIKVMNQEGKVVYSEDLGNVEAGIHTWKWNGRDASGMPVKDGKYSYSISKINGDGTEEDIGGLSHGKVDAVQFDGSNIFLLVNGERYPITSLIEISEEVEEV